MITSTIYINTIYTSHTHTHTPCTNTCTHNENLQSLLSQTSSVHVLKKRVTLRYKETLSTGHSHRCSLFLGSAWNFKYYTMLHTFHTEELINIRGSSSGFACFSLICPSPFSGPPQDLISGKYIPY